jgi:transcriptional regulator with XRE-family HTH domain
MACDEIDIEIGKRLKRARVAAGLSQTQLGVHLGVSFQQVQKYEKGLNRIGGGRLYKIARVLGVKVTYFFDDVEHLLDSETVPAGRNEVGAISDRTIRAAQALADLPDENLRERVFRLIAALPKQKASS